MYSDRYLVTKEVRLDNCDPGDTGKFESKGDAKQKLQADIAALCDLQDKLFAQGRHGVLVVLQGMDTAGKDGVVTHVMSGVNPAGVFVQNFRQPSSEEQRHDYLWRAAKALPERGRIGIFNRSYYEDVIVTRVHPALLGEFEARATEQGAKFWKSRFSDIVGFEDYLADNNIAVLKFFLHISRDEQKKRILARLDNPDKQWKFSVTDLQERPYWDEYARAYEDMLSHTSGARAPWYVIPANHKWFARLAIADIIVARLEELHPENPSLSPAMQDQLAKAKAAIDAEA